MASKKGRVNNIWRKQPQTVVASNLADLLHTVGALQKRLKGGALKKFVCDTWRNVFRDANIQRYFEHPLTDLSIYGRGFTGKASTKTRENVNTNETRRSYVPAANEIWRLFSEQGKRLGEPEFFDFCEQYKPKTLPAPKARKPLTAATKLLHKKVIKDCYENRCPCCEDTLVLDQGGMVINGAEFDHCLGNHIPDAKATWLICGKCHKSMGYYTGVDARLAILRNQFFRYYEAVRRRLEPLL